MQPVVFFLFIFYCKNCRNIQKQGKKDMNIFRTIIKIKTEKHIFWISVHQILALSVQRSAKIKLHSFRKAVIVHQKCGTLFGIYKS